MTQDILVERIRSFLVRQFPTAKNVSNDDPLLKNGVIDSLGVLEVVTFVEDEFSITVSDEDLLPENFGSVEGIAKFVESKSNGAQ